MMPVFVTCFPQTEEKLSEAILLYLKSSGLKYLSYLRMKGEAWSLLIQWQAGNVGEKLWKLKSGCYLGG